LIESLKKNYSTLVEVVLGIQDPHNLFVHLLMNLPAFVMVLYMWNKSKFLRSSLRLDSD